MEMTCDYRRIAVDLSKQWEFERFLTNRMFSDLQEKFRNITFTYEEKENKLVMMYSIVETNLVSLSEVFRLAERVFGKGVPIRGFFKTEHYGKKGLGLSSESPEEYPHHVQISDISIGYWAAIAFLENVTEYSTEVGGLVANFNEKSRVLAKLAEELVARKYPD